MTRWGSLRAVVSAMSSISVAFAAVAADNVQLVDPTLSRFAVPAPDIRGIESKFRGGLSVAQWWTNKFAQSKLRSQLDQLSATAVAEARPIIDWTGQGTLYEIRVAVASEPSAAGWFAAQVIGDKAIQLGTGATPEQALFGVLSSDVLRSGVPDGYAIDPAYSGYFWVAKNTQGQIVSTPIKNGTVRGLHQSIQEQYGQLELAYQVEKMQAKDAWVQMAKVAKQKIGDRNSRDGIDRALKVVLESQSRVAAINVELKKALDADRKASETLRTLQILQTVFSAAELAQQASQEMNVPESQFDGLDKPSLVVKRVEEIATQRGTYRRTVEAKYYGESSQLQSNLNTFWGNLAPARPPAGAEDAVRLGKRP